VVYDVEMVERTDTSELRSNESYEDWSFSLSVNGSFRKTEDVGVPEATQSLSKLIFLNEDVLAKLSDLLEDDSLHVGGMGITDIVTMIGTKEMDLNLHTQLSLQLHPEADGLLFA